MITSILLIIVLSGLLYNEWRRFNNNFMDREIRKFFDDHNQKNT